MSDDGTTFAERAALRASLRSFFARYSPESEVRRVMATDIGYDPDVWRRMADELGLPGFAVPVEYGGSGFGAAELQIVLEEMGRALLCAPFFASAVLATNVLRCSEDGAAAARYLPGLADGSRIATLAALGPSGRWDGADVWTATATAHPVGHPIDQPTDHPAGAGHRLTGAKTFVLDVLAADLLLVTASAPEGPAVFAVEAEGAGVTRAGLASLDETRKLGRVEFDDAEAVLVGTPGRGVDLLTRALALSAPALGAEQVGGARRVLEMAVEYANVREQFGRVIGSFQAIKQKCADMLLAVEAATSAATAAAEAIDAASADRDALAHLALAHSTESFLFAATENIEIHGGIGFTWESAAQLYYKRAVAGTTLLGAPAAHREQLLTALGR